MKKLTYILLLTGVSFLMGCTSTKDTFAKSSAPTMKEIYDDHLDSEPRPQILKEETTVHDAIRVNEPEWPKAVSDLKTEFTLLPNPTLLMYIPAHLTSGGTPVPGYSTFFSFYERQHVALPSETREVE